MVTDLLFWPLVLGVVVSIVIIAKNTSWGTTGLNGVIALVFWSSLFALLYVPNPASTWYTQLSIALGTLGTRFSNFARYFQMLDIIAEAWIASLVVDSTTRFTGTHAGLPYRIGFFLDMIVFVGIGLIFLAFMTGAI